jgi:ZIP family zinc transporter
MESPVLKVLLYACGPAAAMALGGSFAAFRAPGPRLSSYFQHFAAGVVFAALATEILPDVVHQRAPVAAILGFASGTALMLAIRWWTTARTLPGAKAGGESAESNGKAESPISLVATVAVDVLVDGFLIGIGFVAGAQTGVLLTVALGIEVLFLGLSTAAAMSRASWSRGRLISAICGLALLLPTGGAIGAGLLGGLQGAALEVALSFGAAALLYLVTEELLVEAHEVPETAFSTAMFFVGFLVLLIIDMLSQGNPASTGRAAVQSPDRLVTHLLPS